MNFKKKMELELLKLNSDFNNRIDHLLSMIKKETAKSSATDQTDKLSENITENDTEKAISEEFRLERNQLCDFKIFYTTRSKPEKLEESMSKLVELQNANEIGDIVKDSIEKISNEVVEKRKMVAEFKMKIQLTFSQIGVDTVEKFSDSNGKIGEDDLEEGYTNWVKMNKTEKNRINPDQLEGHKNST